MHRPRRRPSPHLRVERRADDEHLLVHARRLLAQDRQELCAADGLVRDHEDPPLVLGGLVGRYGRAQRRLIRPRAHPEDDRDGRQQDEDDEPEPRGDRGGGDDQRDVPDRQQQEADTPRPRCETGYAPWLLRGGRSCVHDDPHYVDEVPVDSGDLDAVVVLGSSGRGRPARGHREQRQPDEDVGAVQAGERRRRPTPNAPSLGLKPMRAYSSICVSRNVEPHQEASARAPPSCPRGCRA